MNIEIIELDAPQIISEKFSGSVEPGVLKEVSLRFTPKLDSREYRDPPKRVQNTRRGIYNKK